MSYFERACTAAVDVINIYLDYILPFIQIYKENVHLKPLEQVIDLELFKNMIIKYSKQDSKLNVIDIRVEIGMF